MLIFTLPMPGAGTLNLPSLCLQPPGDSGSCPAVPGNGLHLPLYICANVLKYHWTSTNLLSLFLCFSSFSSFSPCLPSTSSCLLMSSHLVHAACGVVANHLSPQALKWREYRRRNPLGLDRVSGLPSLASSLDRRQQEPRLNRGNPIFEFPGTLNTSHFHCKLNGAHRPFAIGSGGDQFCVPAMPGFITTLHAMRRSVGASTCSEAVVYKRKVKIAYWWVQLLEPLFFSMS